MHFCYVLKLSDPWAERVNESYPPQTGSPPTLPAPLLSTAQGVRPTQSAVEPVDRETEKENEERM